MSKGVAWNLSESYSALRVIKLRNGCLHRGMPFVMPGLVFHLPSVFLDQKIEGSVELPPELASSFLVGASFSRVVRARTASGEEGSLYGPRARRSCAD